MTCSTGTLEKGDDDVSMGNVLSVLWALGLLPTAKALANPRRTTMAT